MPIMDSSVAERLIFKWVCFIAYLLAAVFLFAGTALGKTVTVVEPEKLIGEAEIPAAEPEKHGGIKCEGCGKDDSDRAPYVNMFCKHVVCENCITLRPKKALLATMQMCPDGLARTRLHDARCKVCSHARGRLRPYRDPVVRAPPEVKTPPSMYRAESSSVQISVGTGSPPKIFTAPECIIIARSRKCARSLKSHPTRKELRIADHDPITFGYVLEFMYRDSIEEDGAKVPSAPRLFDIWALANYLEMVELANYCAWRILRIYDATEGRFFYPDSLDKLYLSKDANRPMKELIMDLRVWTTDETSTLWDKDTSSKILAEHGRRLQSRLTSMPSVNPLETTENYYTDHLPETPPETSSTSVLGPSPPPPRRAAPPNVVVEQAVGRVPRQRKARG